MSEEDEKGRKKWKKRKKKHSDESIDDIDTDKKDRHWSKTKKKRRQLRHKDFGIEDDDEDREQAMNVSAPVVESSPQPSSPVLLEENTKTALCAPSMVIVISFCDLLRCKLSVILTNSNIDCISRHFYC